jgi:hypothetical protein
MHVFQAQAARCIVPIEPPATDLSTKSGAQSHAKLARLSVFEFRQGVRPVLGL